MTWAKVDDGLYDDPRAEAAGAEAMGLWVLALSYMGRYLTDGVIDDARVRKLVGRRGPTLTDRLIKSGWWRRRDDGKLQLIPWDDYLLSRAEVEAERERKSDAGRRGAERTNAKRLETGPACAAPSAGGTSAASRGRDPVPVPSRPVPSQIEDPPKAPQGGPGVAPLKLEPTPPAKASKAGKVGKPDVPVQALAPLELAVYQVIVADESLEPIVKAPARLARDLVSVCPAVDLVSEIRALGAWLRLPGNRKNDGNAFLMRNLKRKQEEGVRAPANRVPRAPTQRHGSEGYPEWDQIPEDVPFRPPPPDPPRELDAAGAARLEELKKMPMSELLRIQQTAGLPGYGGFR